MRGLACVSFDRYLVAVAVEFFRFVLFLFIYLFFFWCEVGSYPSVSKGCERLERNEFVNYPRDH